MANLGEELGDEGLIEGEENEETTFSRVTC
jgi:hypothetical protein